jgi:hypothetical protein
MLISRFILTLLIFLAGCQAGWGQPASPAVEAATPYLVQAYGPPGAVYVPGGSAGQYIGPMTPVYPQPSVLPGTVVMPQPTGVAPGVVAGPQFVAPANPPGTMLNPSLATPPFTPNPVAPVQSLGPNPIVVPVSNEELAWDQIADVVSDYFTIAREDRARLESGTEGRIETAPLTGATWLEPYRKDSVGSFNRWESTFQTIRRRAIVRVIPDEAGYLVEVVVEKELEDLPNPEKGTAGAAVFRGEDSLPSRRLEAVSRTRSSPRWLQLGRDPLLEQRMLGDIQARLGGTVVR